MVRRRRVNIWMYAPVHQRAMERWIRKWRTRVYLRLRTVEILLVGAWPWLRKGKSSEGKWWSSGEGIIQQYSLLDYLVYQASLVVLQAALFAL